MDPCCLSRIAWLSNGLQGDLSPPRNSLKLVVLKCGGEQGELSAGIGRVCQCSKCVGITPRRQCPTFPTFIKLLNFLFLSENARDEDCGIHSLGRSGQTITFLDGVPSAGEGEQQERCIYSGR